MNISCYTDRNIVYIYAPVFTTVNVVYCSYIESARGSPGGGVFRVPT